MPLWRLILQLFVADKWHYYKTNLELCGQLFFKKGNFVSNTFEPISQQKAKLNKCVFNFASWSCLEINSMGSTLRILSIRRLLHPAVLGCTLAKSFVRALDRCAEAARPNYLSSCPLANPWIWSKGDLAGRESDRWNATSFLRVSLLLWPLRPNRVYFNLNKKPHFILV